MLLKEKTVDNESELGSMEKSITSTSLLKITTRINKYYSWFQDSVCAWYHAKHVI